MKKVNWLIVLVVVLLAVGIFFWYRNKKRKQQITDQFTPVPNGSTIADGTVEASTVFPKDARIKSAKAGAIVFKTANSDGARVHTMATGNTSLGISTGRRVFDGKFWLVQVTPFKEWQNKGFPPLVYIGEGKNWQIG